MKKHLLAVLALSSLAIRADAASAPVPGAQRKVTLAFVRTTAEALRVAPMLPALPALIGEQSAHHVFLAENGDAAAVPAVTHPGWAMIATRSRGGELSQKRGWDLDMGRPLNSALESGDIAGAMALVDAFFDEKKEAPAQPGTPGRFTLGAPRVELDDRPQEPKRLSSSDIRVPR